MSGPARAEPVDLRFPGLRAVRADDPGPMTLDGTRTFLLGEGRVVVVDPGPADAAHLEAVYAALAGARVEAIVLTHAHPDHAGNTLALAMLTDAPVMMGAGALRPPFAPQHVSRILRTGDRIASDAGPLEVVETPGHTPEHLALVVGGAGRTKALLAGDLILGEGDTTVVSAPEGDVGQYLRSLEEVGRRSVDLIVPAHGRPCREVAAVLERFRTHRLLRVEQVRAARAALPEAGVAELTQRIYGTGLDRRLRGAAEGSVRAAITYLEGEPTFDRGDVSRGHRGVHGDGTGDGHT